MTFFLKQSTASQEVPLGYALDSTDGNTEKTGLTIANTDIKVWKSGATTLASKNSGGATHIANGIYYVVLDATDSDTLGMLVLFVHVAGALTMKVECCVLAANIYDSLVGGGDLIDISVVQWTGTNVATPDTAGQPKVTVAAGTGTGQLSLAAGVVAASVAGSVGSVTGAVGSVTGNVGGNVVGTVGSVVGAVGSVTGAVGSVTGNVGGNVIGSTGSVTTVSDKTGYALSNTGIDAILDRPIAEPSGIFAWPASLRTIIQWVGALGRNKQTQTATTHLVRNDADSGTLATATVSDDGTTFVHGEFS